MAAFPMIKAKGRAYTLFDNFHFEYEEEIPLGSLQTFIADHLRPAMARKILTMKAKVYKYVDGTNAVVLSDPVFGSFTVRNLHKDESPFRNESNASIVSYAKLKAMAELIRYHAEPM